MINDGQTRELILAAHRSSAKPCPFCGGKNLKFMYHMSYGHGDSGYSRGRIECGDCSGSKGNLCDYGEPGFEAERNAWNIWDTRISVMEGRMPDGEGVFRSEVIDDGENEVRTIKIEIPYNKEDKHD